MTDSTAVFDPGWQAPINPSNFLPYTDVIINFFDANTNNPRTVYSDEALTISLGPSVSCNSAGYPVTSGNAKTLVYIGSAPYRVQATSVLFGGTLFDFVDVRGALDTSSFLTSAAVADQNPIAVSANRTVVAGDKGQLLNVNCTAGAITITLSDAAVLGSGFYVGIRHAGTANEVKIQGDGTDTFAIPGVSVTKFSLTGNGQSIWISCDGTNFKCHSTTPSLIDRTTGRIAIVDILSTPPGSPTPGQRYIVGAAPTGAWSTFAQHDIAEADGFGGWFKYTPATNAGWIAYVQSTSTFYSFRGSAWSLGMMPTPTVQKFTSGTGTYTAPVGLKHIRVRIVGGGGGGAAVNTNNGANGGDTSFASWTAIHGNGGIVGVLSPSLGGTGGASGAGTQIARFDGAGGAGGEGTAAGGGGGGASIFGGAGTGGSPNVGVAARANSGSGGGGGAAAGNSSGGGGAGEYVEFFMTATQVGTSVSYAVGAGGAGGAAGNQPGGAGAAGVIIIEEFY